LKKLYERHILPKLVHRACGIKTIRELRSRVVPSARGIVLEIGFGTGLNLPFYDPACVEHLWALEPSREMWKMAQEQADRAPFSVAFLKARAEEIPLEDEAVDTVVVTYALCTIPDIQRALAEIRRVLIPGGRLLFCEHGASPEEKVVRWQNRLNPVWSCIGGGCQLNRDIAGILESNRFEMKMLTTGYRKGWRISSFHYWGVAAPTG
jgi:ubiquinone/menaquinone biosynthesis C-methylase UbiE